MTPDATRSLPLLTAYLRPQWRRVAALAALVLIGIGLQLVAPHLLRLFIDAATSDGPLDLMIGVALGYLGVALVGQALYVATNYLGADVGWTATNALRADLALHCLRLDLAFFAAHRPGEVMERVDGDTATLANFFSQFVIRIAGNAVLLVGVLVLTAAVDWRLGGLLAAFVAITLAVVKGLQGLGVPAFRAWRQAVADSAGFWEERLAGSEDIRANGGTPHVMRLHDAIVRGLMHAVRRATLAGRVVLGAWEVLGAAGNAALFLLAAWLLRTGALTIGAVYLVYAYAGMLATIVLQINYELEDLQRALAAVGRIRDLAATPIRVRDGTAPLPPGPLAVAGERLSFAYAPGTPVLVDVSFTLAPGRVLGLLGRTGSGKTTLARLIARLYPVEEGVIRLNGADLGDLRLDDLRRRVGLVTQEVQLFQATVRDNLTFFDPSIADERLLHALRELGLEEWFARLPLGLETPLAAGGGDLSAGEAQLLALARVFLRDPGLVILDESASRLDPASERRVGAAVARLLAGRTGIVIAHRLATVARADEILILEAGRVREYGPYQALAADPSSHLAALLRVGLEGARR